MSSWPAEITLEGRMSASTAAEAEGCLGCLGCRWSLPEFAPETSAPGASSKGGHLNAGLLITRLMLLLSGLQVVAILVEPTSAVP
jgi:hypothetical protein